MWLRKILFVVVVALCTVRSFETDLDQNVSAIKSVKTSGGRAAFERENGICSDDWESPPLTESEISKSKFFSESSSQTESNFESMNSEFTSSNTNSEFESMTSKNEFFSQSSLSQSEYEATNFQINSSNVNSEVHNDDYSASTFKSESSQNIVKSTEEKSTSFNDSPSWNSGWDNKPRSNPELDFNKFREETPFSSSLQGLDQQNNQVPLHDFPADTVNNMNSEQENMFKFPNNNLDKIEFESVPIKEETEIPTQWPHLKKPEYDFGDLTESSPLHSLPTQSEQNSPKSSEDFPSQNDLHLPFPSEINDHEGSSNQSNTDSSEEKGDKKCKFGESVESNESPIDCLKSTTEEAEHMEDQVSENPELNSEKASLTSSIVNAPDSNAYSDLLSNQPSTLRPYSENIPSTGSEKLASPISESLDSLAKSPKESKFEQPEHGPFKLPEETSPFHTDFPKESMPGHPGSLEESLPCHHESSEESSPCYPELLIKQLPCHRESSEESSRCHPELPTEPLPCHPRSSEESSSCHRDSSEKSKPDYPRSPVEPIFNHYGSSEELLPHSSEFSTESFSHDHGSSEELLPCYPEYPIQPLPCCHGSSVESSPCCPELPLEPLPCHPESIKELPSCHFDSLEKSIPDHLRSPVEPILCLNGSSEESSSCDQESPEELAPCYPEFPVEPLPCHQEVPSEKLCYPNLSEGSSPYQPDSSEESFPHHLDYLEESKPYYPEFSQEPLSCLHSSEEHGSSEESSQCHRNSSEELNPCTNSSEEMIPCHCHSPEELLPGHPDTLEKLSSCHCQSVSPVEPFHSQPGYMEELPESENIVAAKSVSSNKSPLGPVSPLTTPPNGLSGLIKPYHYNQSSLSYPQTSFPYGTPSPYEHPDYPRGLPYQKNIPHPYASNLFPPGTLDSPHKYSPTTIPSHYPQKHPSFGQPGNSEPPLYEYPSHGYPPHGYPQHGYPPHGYPPHGYPPHGYPPYGYPPYGYPPHGYPPHGYPPPGYPSHGYPPYRYSPNGYPFNTSPYEHPFGGSPYGPYNPHRKPPNGSPGSHTTKPPYNQNVPLNNIPTSSSQPSAYGQSGFDETPESLLDQFPHMENTLPKEASNVLPYTSEGSPLESTNPWEQYQNEHSNFPEKSLYDATTNSTPAPELSNMSNLNDLPFEKSHHGQPLPSSTNQSEMSDSTPTTFPFHPKPSEEESCGESSFPSQPPNMNKSSPGQDYFSSSKLPYLDAGSSGSALANPEAMYPLSLKPGRTFLPRGTSPFPSSHKLESSLELESQYPSSINQYPLNENSESPDDLHGPNSLQMRPPTHSCNKQYPEKPLHGPYGFEEDCLAPNTNPCSPDQQDLLHETSHNPKNPLEPTFQPVNTEEFANKLQHSPEDDSFYPQTTPYSSHKPDYPKNPLELMINYGPEEKMGFPPSLHNTEEHLKQPFLIDSKNFETNSEYPQKKLPWPNQTSNMLKSSLSDMPTSNFVLPENGVSPKSTSELPADDLHPPKSASELLADDLHQTHPPITSSLNRNSVTPDDLLSSLPETQDSIMPNTSPLTTSNTVTPDILSSLQKSPEASILQNSPSHPETAALPSNNPAAQNDLLSSLPDTQDSITPDIASLSNSNAVIPDNLSLLQKSPEDSILQNLPSHPETASLPDRNPGTSVDLTLPDSNPGTSVDLTSAFPETLEDSIMPENAPSPSTNLETPVHLPSTPDSISNPSSLPLPDSNPISNKHTSSGRGRMKGVPVTDSVPEYVLNDLDQLYEETKSKYLSCYSEYPQNIGEIIDSLDDESLTYHTVIVGSGAGALSALKDLVDANKSVLIVEQGRLPPQKCMSMYYRSGLLNTNYVTPYKASIPGCSVEKIIFAPNVVGGTTSYDLNTWDHGALEKYRNWGQDCKKWSWEKVAKHYQSMEMTEKTERNTQEREEILPNGSIVITRDITETATTKRVIKAFREVGIRESSYELDGARRSPGITIIPMIHQRQDNSLYAQRMFEQIKNKDNLHIALETEATQIIFENGKAVAVTIVTPSGSIRTVHIKEELILGGGPISTVNILYHSGIGDASLLQQLQIPVQSHVPHLGKDLMVYPMYPALCMKFPSGSLIAESESDYAAIGHMFGETTMSPGLALSYYKAFLQVYDSPQPNVQINLFAFSKRMPTRMKNYMSGLFQFDKETQEYVYRMSEQHDLMFVVPQLLDTESKGEITINSADYRAQPVINTGMYNSGRDLMIMEKTIGIIKRLSKTKTFRGISGELVQIPVRGCEGAPFTKQFNECSIRHCSVPGLHPTGGAIMGHNPLTSVVDEELIVHGTKNVRCFSAAVLPKGVAADSSAAACVVGKYGAALMLGN